MSEYRTTNSFVNTVQKLDKVKIHTKDDNIYEGDVVEKTKLKCTINTGEEGEFVVIIAGAKEYNLVEIHRNKTTKSDNNVLLQRVKYHTNIDTDKKEITTEEFKKAIII